MTEENRIFAKCAWRLIPFMGLLYIVNFLDRVNVGFAALTMNKDIGLGDEAYGLGAGIFFLSYFLFEVPSNIILERVGARLWIFRIMLTWGIVSMAMAFARGPASFYALRFLLGVAEAGFFPGMIFYLTLWFPNITRARYTALFVAAIPLSNIIGSPLSGLILGMGPHAGLHSWQWLFLIEGAPSVLLAFAVLLFLPDRPAKARWLSETEKGVIDEHLATEPPRDHHALLPMLRDPRVWILAIPDFGIVLAFYGLGLWMPQIIHSLGFSIGETGFVTAVPYVVSILAMVAWARSSDLRGDRVWHVAVAAVAGAVALVAAAFLGTNLWSVLALTIAMACALAALSVFWTLPSSFLGGRAAAGGIALINSFANLGGFFGPAIMGWLKQKTHGYAIGLDVLALGLLVAAAMVLVLGRSLRFKARAVDRFAPPA